MSYPPDFWFAWNRHEDLLLEAGRERRARELRRARAARERGRPKDTVVAGTARRTSVRRGLAEDASRIADLLELRGVPRWVAFEEHFIVAESGGGIVGVLRFRRELWRLYLGLLVLDPQVEEEPMVADLYAGARTVARELGATEIRTRTRQHGAHLAKARYRKEREGWRLDVDS